MPMLGDLAGAVQSPMLPGDFENKAVDSVPPVACWVQTRSRVRGEGRVSGRAAGRAHLPARQPAVMLTGLTRPCNP